MSVMRSAAALVRLPIRPLIDPAAMARDAADFVHRLADVFDVTRFAGAIAIAAKLR